jgi:hypothetical protein
MRIFTAFTSDACAFDPHTHCSQGTPVHTLEIAQEEGHCAKATLSLPAHTSIPEGRSFMLISVQQGDTQPTCLLRGFLVSAPQKVNGTLCQIDVLAQPGDHDAQLKRLINTHKKTDFYDPLLFESDKDFSPSLITLTRPVTLEIDRCTHNIQYVSLFGEAEPEDISRHADTAHTHIRAGHTPLGSVHVKLQAQWVQRSGGVLNLSRRLSGLFQEGTINTFTGADLKNSWPKAGSLLGRSGWKVAYSSLNEVPKNARTLSQAFWVREAEGAEKKQIKRRWFEGKLLLSWDFKQKRNETLVFTLEHAFQRSPLLPSSDARCLSLKIPVKRKIGTNCTLNPWEPCQRYRAGDEVIYDAHIYACTRTHTSSDWWAQDTHLWQQKEAVDHTLHHPAAISFFTGTRGQKVCDIAIAIAQTALARTARALHFSTRIPLAHFMHLTTRSVLALTAPWVPGGRIQGKVISYKVTAHAHEPAYIDVTCAASVGVRQTAPQPDATDGDDTYAPGYALGYTVCSGKVVTAPCGLSRPDYTEQTPQDAYAKLAQERPEGLLAHISLVNPPETQAERLQHATQPDKAVSLQENTQFGTQIDLDFCSLNTQEQLNHRIAFSLPAPWYSPHHINLSSHGGSL